MLDFNFASHDEICREIGQRLKARRFGLDLTQADVALRAGVSKGTVSNIEQQGQGTLQSFIRVLQAMNMVRELQPLFMDQLVSIDQLKSRHTPDQRQRVSRKRRP